MSRRETKTFYSVFQIAESLALHEKTVRRMVTDGRLPAHRIGRQLRISDEDYKVYVASRRGQ